MAEAQILVSYPRLWAADLVSAWAYVAAHPGAIDRQIRENAEPSLPDAPPARPP